MGFTIYCDDDGNPAPPTAASTATAAAAQVDDEHNSSMMDLSSDPTGGVRRPLGDISADVANSRAGAFATEKAKNDSFVMDVSQGEEEDSAKEDLPTEGEEEEDEEEAWPSAEALAEEADMLDMQEYRPEIYSYLKEIEVRLLHLQMF